MCDLRWAGKEKERPQPGWSHLYGRSFSLFISLGGAVVMTEVLWQTLL